MLHFEDFRPGEVTRFGGVTVERDAMVAFAREYDPQPFHLDEAAARETFVGHLIASGWYTAALQMRMLCDAFLLEAAGMGAPGIEELNWLKPVLAGDRLSVRQTVLDTKTSRSRPEMGLVQFRLDTLNGDDHVVMNQTNWVMFRRRGVDSVAPHGGGALVTPASATSSAGADQARSGPVVVPHFDALEIGHTEELGQHVFSPDEIVRFARAFDPQPFHMDEAAGRASPFGGLVASGWHTAAAWMKALVAHRAAAMVHAAETGIAPPRYGSSPGFKNLCWLKPVRAGDTIRYATTLTDKRVSASRPGWGLTFSRNTGHNQHGELVFSFDGCGFVARDPG